MKRLFSRLGLVLGLCYFVISVQCIDEQPHGAPNTDIRKTAQGTVHSDDPQAQGKEGHIDTLLNGNNNATHGGGHTKYQVFHFDFDGVEAAYVVSLWIFIASIAKIGFHLNNKLSSIFPESCLLIILGIVVGIIVYLTLQFNNPGGSDAQAQSPQYSLHAVTFFQFLLPPIILDAGYFMPNRAFFNNIGTILLYAVVGTCFNTASIGLTLYGVTQAGLTNAKDVKLLHCLVFSSLISAVDPVAVLAVFEEIHVNEQLHIVVFGESLLNDAVTVVLYHMFIEYDLQPEITVMDVFAGLLQFFIVGLGGVLIGVLFGLFCAFITKYTSHVRVIEPIFVFLLAYLAYLTAEMFHLSGIMALTFCGITMKQYVVYNISEKSQTTIKYFLKMLSSMTETVIFMMLGTSAVKDNHDWDVWFIFITILACLVYRTIGTVCLTAVANKYRVSKLKAVDQFVMAYGGLRGAIAFALAILINERNFPQKELFVTATICVVMFTVFVQGITIKPLVNFLKVKKKHQGPTSMGEQIHTRMLDHMMAAVEDITGYRGNHTMRDKWEYFDNKYLRKILLREKQMTKEHGILRTHSKLSLKDAMHSMHSGFSAANLQTNGNGQSLLRLISNWSVSSFQDHASSHGGSEAELHHNDTVVDMQALDAHFSKKIADDTKTHHMLEDNLIVPRAKLSMKQHQRHTIDDVDGDHRHSSYFHHSAKLHLRHMISKHQHHLAERKKQKDKARQEKNNGMPKNVSFANIAEPNGHSHYNQGRVTEADEDDSDDGMGIEFTARSGNGSEGDITDCQEPMSPVALECQLPWKRLVSAQETEPMCSMETHLLPNDNTPSVCPVPSWADNLDYNNIPALSPRSPDIVEASQLNGRLNRSNNNSTADMDLCSLGNGRVLPLIPVITIESPRQSSDNLGGLLMTAERRYPDYDGDERQTDSVTDSGTSHPNSESISSSSSPEVSSPEVTPCSNYSDTDDDEEVEIKPFGRVPLTAAAHGSGPKLARQDQCDTESVTDMDGEDTPQSNKVLFTIDHDASSEEESSMGIHC